MQKYVRKGLGSVVLGNIKHRRRQNAALMLGVMLSVYFLSACLFGASTMLASSKEANERAYGRQTIVCWETGGVDMSSLQQEGYVGEMVNEEVLYTSAGDPDTEDDDFNIARYTPELDSMRRFLLADGRLPEKQGEIAIEFGALMRMRQDAGLGDEITLTLESFDGYAVMPETHEKTFTLVGVLKNKQCYDNSWTTDQTIPLFRLSEALVHESEQVLPGSAELVSTLGVYCGPLDKQANPETLAWEKTHEHLFEGHRFGFRYDYKWRADTIGSMFLAGDSDAVVTLFCVIIVFFTLTAASMISIASMLASNIEKRSTQIGMLRAIGATKKQIRRLLLRETLLIALITLPLGVAAAWGTLALLARFYPDAVVCSVPVWMLAADIVACGACVCLSSWLPLRTSMRITPMQAVRDINKARLFKQLGWKSKKDFRPAKLLAKRNNALRRGRTRGLTALVCCGCVFFCLLFWLAMEIVAQLSMNMADYQYHLYNYNTSARGYMNDLGGHGGHITAQDKRDIESVPYVERVECVEEFAVSILLDEVTDYITAEGKEIGFSYLSPDVSPAELHLIENGHYDGITYQNGGDHLTNAQQQAREMHETYLQTKENMGWQGKEAVYTNMVALSDGLFDGIERYVIGGNVDKEKIDSGEQVLIIAPQEYAYMLESSDQGFFFAQPVYGKDIKPEYGELYQNDTFFAGNALDLSVAFVEPDGYVSQNRLSPAIGAVLSHDAEYFASAGSIGRFTVITSLRGAQSMGLDGAYNHFRIYCAPFPDDQTRELVSAEIEAISLRSTFSNFSDLVETAGENARMMRIYLIACAVLFVLVFAFSFGMLSSAVGGKIRADIHQIGTMRAVGASKRAVFSGYAWQLYRMFLFGGGAAVLLSALFALFLAVNNADPVRAALQLLAAPLYLALLLGLCRLSVKIKLRPIFRSSVVENIRVL